MLPGFVHTKKPEYKICKKLAELETDITNHSLKDIKFYFNSCEEKCELFHKERILIFLLKTKDYRDINIALESLSSEKPIIRFLSLKILLNVNETAENLLIFYLNDPFFKIRSLILKYILKNNKRINSEKIKELINDENPEVKKLAIKCFIKFERKNNEFICEFITDKNKEVRILIAKSLKKLKIKDYKSLFSKSENGAFIYGLEDENEKVRLETLKSISHMCKNSIKDEAFDFLTYLLNDEREKLRLVASKVLKKLSKKFLWKIPLENLKLLLLTLEDKNRKIVKNVLFVVGKLIYSLETFFIFNKLIEKLQTGKHKVMFFTCIKEIVKTNLELFNTHSNEISNNITIFKNKGINLEKDRYTANLIVLNELNKKGYDFEGKDLLKNEFNFLKIKLHKEKKIHLEDEFLVYKNTFLSLLNNLTKNINFYKKFFYKNDSENSFYKFFYEMYKGIVFFKNTNNFNVVNYCLKKYQINLKKFNYSEKIDDLNNLKEIIVNLNMNEIKNVFFMINILSNEIYSKTTFLDCKIRIATNCKNGYFLRIKDDTTDEKCYYKIKSIIHVFFSIDNLENLSICVVKKEKEDILLTKPQKLINKLN